MIPSARCRYQPGHRCQGTACNMDRSWRAAVPPRKINGQQTNQSELIRANCLISVIRQLTRDKGSNQRERNDESDNNERNSLSLETGRVA
jgi:hypothetical protein